jgi:predicted transposase YbfD/YdcC
LYQYSVLPESLSYSRVFSVKPTGVSSLYPMLSKIPDPRSPQGRRHPLQLLLTLAILSLCSGEVTYQAMEEWVANYQKQLKKKVPYLAHHFIDASTFHRVFARLDTLKLEMVLSEWLQIISGVGVNEPIAIDGKTLSGVDCHLLSAFAHRAKSVLFEVGTDTKGKEIPLALELLDRIPVKGHIITADALHTQREFCRKVTLLGGGYALTAKGNQERLSEDIRLFFTDPPFKTSIKKGETIERDKGKLIRQNIRVTKDLNDYLSWPGVTHIWQLTREVTHIKTKQTTTEVAVGIARLLGEEDNPSLKIMGLIRGHWSIENRLHRQRDVVFLEDRSTIRKSNAPQVMAALKNLVISIYHRAQVRYFPAAFRRFLASPEELFNFLGLTRVAI